MKDLLRTGYLVWLMDLTKDTLVNLTFHLGVMWANQKCRDSEKLQYQAYLIMKAL